MLRESGPQATIWELLPEEAKRLPAELARVDAYLDDGRFVAPWRALFSARLGRPSVPVEVLLRMLYHKHRDQLGYESLCREVGDSISWRRFCRIGLDGRVPHPTKLVRRAGPEVVEELKAALLGKLREDRLLRGAQAAGRHHCGGGRRRPPHRRRPAEEGGAHAGWAGPARPAAWRGHPHRVRGPVAVGGG